VVQFNTDKEGKADIQLRDKGPKHDESKNGKVKIQLPAALRPVSGINELVVLDANGATVLTADLTAPDKFEYLVKRDLSTDTVDALLQIKANGHKAQVRLSASGLDAGAEYSLALNGTVAGSASADTKGKLKIGAELDSPGDILALSSVALLDAGTNTVVSTTLP
jgi:hypothetical protein